MLHVLQDVAIHPRSLQYPPPLLTRGERKGADDVCLIQFVSQISPNLGKGMNESRERNSPNGIQKN